MKESPTTDAHVGHRRRSCLLLLLTAMACAACSPRHLAETALIGDHFTHVEGVHYGDAQRQRLDVYVPDEVSGPAPVVVFLYGGRWQQGSRSEYRLLGDAFTRRGVILVVPDYRLYPDVHFPAWIEDAALAVRWTQENIGAIGGDTTGIHVIGHSAGAHTAVLLGLDPQYLQHAGVRSGFIRGVVSVAGPVAVAWTDADVQALMGPPSAWPSTYPTTHASDSGPPLLLLHGSKDRTVAPANSTRLASLIRSRGGCADAIVYPGLGHIAIIVAVAVPRLDIAPVMTDIVRFVRQGSISSRRNVMMRTSAPSDRAC